MYLRLGYAAAERIILEHHSALIGGLADGEGVGEGLGRGPVGGRNVEQARLPRSDHVGARAIQRVLLLGLHSHAHTGVCVISSVGRVVYPSGGSTTARPRRRHAGQYWLEP
jgi:hypothetical protein